MCSIHRAYNTTYNDNREVPPYTGLMFEVTAIGDPLKILTLELDLRLENATDLSVEVYSLSGQFAELFNQPDAWDLVAATQVVVTPGGGGAVIPVQDFTPVRIGANERHSFYVTMKGPYLDHTVYALQKTGEIQSRGDDLQVFVGAGLTEYKFPEQLDDVLNPMFAGVIHYEKEFDCGTVLTSTAYLDFPFLFEESVDMRIVTMAINEAVDELLKEEDELKSYVSRFGLQKRDSGETEAISYTCKWSQHLFRRRSSFVFSASHPFHTLFLTLDSSQFPVPLPGKNVLHLTSTQGFDLPTKTL